MADDSVCQYSKRQSSEATLTHTYCVEEEVGIPYKAIRQITFLRSLEHPNIIKLLGVHMDSDGKGLRLEYEPHGINLRTHLKSHGPLCERRLQRVSYQCIRGVQWLHRHGIAGLGLGARSVCIEPGSDRAVISNLSVSVSCFMSCSRNVSLQEAWAGCPLDVLLGNEVPVEAAPKMDVWSLGCLVGYMTKARPIFLGMHRFEMILAIFGVLGTPDETTWPGVTKLPHFSRRFPKWQGVGLAAVVGTTVQPACLDLLQAALRYDPHARPSSLGLMRHRWFDDFRLDPEVRSLAHTLTRGQPRSLARACSESAGGDRQDCFGHWVRKELLAYLGAPLCSYVANGRQESKFPALSSAHRLSQVHYPAVLRGMQEWLSAGREYDETVAWCLKAFEVMGFPDRVLLRTMMVFLSVSHEVKRGVVPLLAAVSLALKLSCEMEYWENDVGRVVEWASRETIKFDDVVPVEAIMVAALRGNLAMPIALDFVDLLRFEARHRGIKLRRPCRELASLLVQLSLLDCKLHFGTTPMTLAVSCLAMAVFQTQAPRGTLKGMIEAVAPFYGSKSKLRAELFECSGALTELARSSRAHQDPLSASARFWAKAEKHEQQQPAAGIPVEFLGFEQWLSVEFEALRERA